MAETTALAAIAAEMCRARDLHGPRYMGNLTLVQKDDAAQDGMCRALKDALWWARHICDGPEPTRLAVLVEEVCELALEADSVPFPRHELVQVAAMALVWLGVEPDESSSIEYPTVREVITVDADCAACIGVGIDFSPTCNGKPCPHWGENNG